MKVGTQSPSVSESPKCWASSGIESMTRQGCVFEALRSSLQSAAPSACPLWAMLGSEGGGHSQRRVSAPREAEV